MQPSKSSVYVKRILKAIAFIVIFLIINIFLCMAFEFKELETEKMFKSYAQKEDIDTVILGNSVAHMIDDDKLSQLMNINACNMCTPDQDYKVSLRALSIADNRYAIKRAVLVTTFDLLSNENGEIIEKVFDRTVSRSFSPGDRLLHIVKRNAADSLHADTVRSEASINLWIPWISEMVGSYDEIKSNLELRFGRIRNGQEPMKELSGFIDKESYEEDFITFDEETLLEYEKDMEYKRDLGILMEARSEQSLEEMLGLIEYCRENDIELVVVISPHRTDYFDRYEGYYDYWKKVDSFLEEYDSKRGFAYYNFEDDPQIHEKLPDEYFKDWEHIADDYKEQATIVWAKKLTELFE